VIRSDLIACLSDVENKQLTVISAPAGFGKTTLLAEWIAQTSMPVAWLSLDNGDNEPYRFLAYLIAALESIREGVGTEARQIMQSPQLIPPHIILASLINDLGSLAEPCVLVLDDYQFITEHAVHETVAYLLEYLPANLHLLISTRADPPLQLGRFRAHGQMLELRTHDLRFTLTETVEFLNDLMRLNLSEEDIEALEIRTEGWVVGLKMAALSLQGREDASEFIRVFSGSHRYVLDYLVEEVLKRQPAPIQKFLLQTSILEKLNGPLCDVLMPEEWRQSGESGQSILEHLARNNLFLISVDEQLNWFRYHHLFADLLRAQLQKSLGNEDLARLHLLAATWFEQNGLILDAIHHASLASDDQRVERLIRQNYLDMMNRGELSWVRSWMGSLSRELVYQRPWLCLYEAMNRCWFGQLDEANVLLYEADKRIQKEAPSPDKQSLLGYHSYIKSRVTAMQGDTRQAIAFCIKAREVAPADRLDMQIDFSITLGYEYFLCGDFISAERILNETIETGNLARAINNPVAAYCLLARSRVYQGRLHQAEDLLQKAAHLIGPERGHYLGVVGLLDVETAALLCEWNDLEAALVRVKRGLDCLPWWGKADDFCLAYVTLARILLAQGNMTEAVNAIKKALQLVQTCGIFSEARSAVDAAQVKLCLLQQDWSAVDRWIAALEKRFESHEPFQYEDELTHITQARVLIAQKKPEEAIRLLSCLEEMAESSGRMGRLIQILLLKGLALQTVGETTQAVSAIQKSLALAQPEGYVRTFLDENPLIFPLLRESRETLGDLQLRNYIDRLLETGTQPQS
jgi:LuxR family maltose regulon positive regulatory protein